MKLVTVLTTGLGIGRNSTQLSVSPTLPEELHVGYRQPTPYLEVVLIPKVYCMNGSTVKQTGLAAPPATRMHRTLTILPSRLLTSSKPDQSLSPSTLKPKMTLAVTAVSPV